MVASLAYSSHGATLNGSTPISVSAQSIDGPENERRGWGFAIDAARCAGNSEAVHELEAIAPYAAPGQPVPIKDLYVQRKGVGYYGSVMTYRTDNLADSDLAQLSPDYSDQEISHIWDGNKFAPPFCFLIWSRPISPRSATSKFP